MLMQSWLRARSKESLCCPSSKRAQASVKDWMPCARHSPPLKHSDLAPVFQGYHLLPQINEVSSMNKKQ